MCVVFVSMSMDMGPHLGSLDFAHSLLKDLLGLNFYATLTVFAEVKAFEAVRRGIYLLYMIGLIWVAAI